MVLARQLGQGGGVAVGTSRLNAKALSFSHRCSMSRFGDMGDLVPRRPQKTEALIKDAAMHCISSLVNLLPSPRQGPGSSRCLSETTCSLFEMKSLVALFVAGRVETEQLIAERYHAGVT